MADGIVSDHASPDPDELQRLGRRIRRNSQALAADLAKLRDELAKIGIGMDFSLAPDREYDRRERTRTP
jgi:hypothetical protein